MINSYMIPKVPPQFFLFSRCGRTDSGVSGRNQVISLFIRTNINTGITFGDVQAAIEQKLEPSYVFDSSYESLNTYNYIEMINKHLPSFMYLTEYAFVQNSFDARFSSQTRSYVYILPKIASTEELKQISEVFLGEHNFKNVCKPKPGVENFVRTIYEISLTEHVEYIELHITGSAFLYHQIRCLVALIVLVVKKKITLEQL